MKYDKMYLPSSEAKTKAVCRTTQSGWKKSFGYKRRNDHCSTKMIVLGSNWRSAKLNVKLKERAESRFASCLHIWITWRFPVACRLGFPPLSTIHYPYENAQDVNILRQNWCNKPFSADDVTASFLMIFLSITIRK